MQRVESKSVNIFGKVSIFLVVLISGASSMIFEIVAPRLFAPYFGTSTYIWTVIIGVVMIGLSLGYFAGGKLADAKPHKSTLVTLYLISSIIAFLTWIFKDYILNAITVRDFGTIYQSLVASGIILFPLNFVLGMVTPVVVRLLTVDEKTSGSIAGNVYATATIGSITGTFLCGLWLIPNFGLHNIFFGVSVALIICTMIVANSVIKRLAFILFLLFNIFIYQTNNPKSYFANIYEKLNSVKVVADIDTNYGRIWITDYQFGANPVRTLADSQSFLFLNKPITYTMRDFLSYYSYFNLAPHYNSEIKSALMIGGGAYTYASYLMENYPNLDLDVVEIDPKLLEISQVYFDLNSSDKFINISQDGRVFLNTNTKKYDVIFLDAYRNGTAIPFQLSTIEAYNKMYDSLNDGGLLFVNVISSLDGNRSALFKAQYKTAKAVFPEVYTFPVENDDPTYYQNIVLMAYKGNKNITNIEFNDKDIKLKTLSQRLTNVEKYVKNGFVLTDDYAPVEYLDLVGSL